MDASSETTLASDRSAAEAAVGTRDAEATLAAPEMLTPDAVPAAAASLPRTSRASREAWLDHAKGIGIVLVVYGHLLSSGYHAGVHVPARFFALSDSILYTFHMPLFFFLAGLTVAGSYARRGARRFAREKFVHLARPYVIWSVAQIGAELVFSKDTFRAVDWGTLLALPILPHDQYWFLYALLCAYLLYAAIRAARWPLAGLAVVSAGLFIFPVRTEIAALDSICVLLPFFVAGIALGGNALRRGVRAAPIWLPVLLTAALLAEGALVFTRWVPPMRLTEQARGAHHALAFLTLAPLGVAACVAWAHALARAQAAGTRGVRALSRIGRYSMPIYLMHMLVGVPARIALARGAHLHSPALIVGAGVLAAVCVPIAAYRVGAAYGFRWLFE